MRANKKNELIIWLLNKACGILPVFFWLFLIFGFEEPCMALVTLGSALMHEAGHIGYIMLSRGLKPNIRGVLNGLKIKSYGNLSYAEEIKLSLAGPIMNIVLFVLFSLFSVLLGERMLITAMINLATALSNLLPIEGYDGYGALMAYIRGRELGESIEHFLVCISSGLIFLLCIFSLYLIDRVGGGYWIFAVFFISMIKCIRNTLRE